MSLLSFPNIWYETYKLKRRCRQERWSDDQYYREMFSIPALCHEVEGDKFASLRSRVTAGIRKDRSSARVLDVATGRGYQARNIREHGYRNVCACDLVPQRVAQARMLHAGSGIEFVVGNAARLPFPDGYFDAITVSAALHDMTPDEVLWTIRGCARMLRAGGRFVLLEPHHLERISSPVMRRVYPFIADLLDESLHMRDYVRLDLVSLLKCEGFECTGCDAVWGGILCLYSCVKGGD